MRRGLISIIITAFWFPLCGTAQNGQLKLRTPLIVLLCLIMFAACKTVSDDSFDIDSITSYRDVPGVTQDEISAIEKLKATRENFSYGQMLETEMFILPDGTYAGFTTKLCELLSTLFDADFDPEIYDWVELKSGIDEKSIDFTGDFTPTEQRMSHYHMTAPIVERSQRIFTLASSDRIKSERDIVGLKIGFLEGSADAESIKGSYPDLEFDIVEASSIYNAISLLQLGQIDAYIGENVASPLIDKYDFIKSIDAFPLAYTPVSLATANPELEPIISVINKYIDAGGIEKIFELYKEGEREYNKHRLHTSFTDEERAYLDNLSAQGKRVKLALESGNYPISFYNDKNKQFEGIAPEILEEISALTGIEFINVVTQDTPWPDIFSGLKSGEISMVSELLYTDVRKNDFIWGSTPYSQSNYVLLSRIDYPNQEMYQVPYSSVGIVSQIGPGDIYRARFGSSDNIVIYSTTNDAFAALEKGEIDLFMTTELMLLKQTNYLERSGFKINISFNVKAYSQFGFSKNEEVLRSIIDKAQSYVDTDLITRGWTTRVFDYTRTYATERATYLSIFVAILFILIIIGIFFFLHSKGLSSDLEKQTATLSTMFKSIPDLVYCEDTNCVYTSCNTGYEEFAGLEASQIIGKTATQIFTHNEEMARGFLEIDQKVIRENTTQILEEWFIYSDGRRKLMETIKTPLIQNGATVGLLGISRDITEHKMAVEDAKAASMAKSMFLAHMSHEIRTPMNAIIGMAELNLREDMAPNVHENTLGIKHAGANLLSIINDILDFSKIEAGKLEIIPEEYMLVSLINDVLNIIRMRITEKPLLFVANIDCNTPGRLIGDEARLRQILLNILGNAVKYANEGFVSIAISSEISEDTAVLTITISDSGTGIKEEDIDKLFTNFIQLSNAKGVQGTGLGLAITKSLCMAMGGDITVSSEYGVGSTFTITLPQKINTYEKFACLEKSEYKQALVYESRPVYADSIVKSLENLGVSCTIVTSQPEFSEKLGNNKYPLIFISSLLFREAERLINSLKIGSKLVLITEFGETVPTQNIGTLMMPAHSLSIANILNDVTNEARYTAAGKADIPFTAPSARVLIVDDVGTNLKVAEGLMSPYKMRIDTCKSGVEALKLVAVNRYDVIFMDHMMPVMDGVETTDKIRAIEDAGGYYKNVPIIALTANAVTGMKDMFLQSGMNDFLAKPIELQKLNSILERWLPAEKRERYIDKKASEGFEIAGIDIKAGVSSAGGVENYFNELTVFHRDGWEKVNEIAECLEHDDLKLYTSHVNELRGAATKIGARRVSDLARTLEIAGKSGARAFMRENTEDLLAELKTLLQNIKAALMRAPDKNLELGESDADLLKSGLLKLKDAIERMEAGSIDRVLSELENKAWDAEISDAIEDISMHILLSDYDKAVELIDGLL